MTSPALAAAEVEALADDLRTIAEIEAALEKADAPRRREESDRMSKQPEHYMPPQKCCKRGRRMARCVEIRVDTSDVPEFMGFCKMHLDTAAQALMALKEEYEQMDEAKSRVTE